MRRVAALLTVLSTVLLSLACMSGVGVRMGSMDTDGVAAPAGSTCFFIGGDVQGITVRCMTVRDGARSGRVLLIRW